MFISSKYFPYSLYNKTYSYKNLVTIGIGGNLKNCVNTFNLLFTRMKNNTCLRIHNSSIIYKNKAFGYTHQPDFYNATIIFSTNLYLRAVFSLMFYYERLFGRKRKREFKNAPRVLDIDIIFFNDIKVRLNHLYLPHKDYKNRLSVLLPLLTQLPSLKGSK